MVIIHAPVHAADEGALDPPQLVDILSQLA